MVDELLLVSQSKRRAQTRRFLIEVKNLGTTLLLLLLFLGLWQFAASDGFVRLIPRPMTILTTVIDNWARFSSNMKQTMIEAAWGFTFGTTFGVLISIGFVYSRTFARSIYPFLVFLQCMPLIALMPLLVLWFGTGLASKVVLIILATFFPTVINVVQGLNSLDKQVWELMESINASQRAIFWKARVPFMLPYLFTAMRITLTTAILAAIISEWLWATKGLGAMIVLAMYNAQTEILWSAMFLATCLSLSAFSLIVILEKIVIPWHAPK